MFMPELPEVETVKRTLEARVKSKRIIGVQIIYGGIIEGIEPWLFQDKVVNRTIEKLERRGKYLLFHLSGEYLLIIHLRMTGQLLYVQPDAPKSKHLHLIFFLDDGRELRYVDMRKFGKIYLIPCASVSNLKGLSSLGVDPLSKEFSLKKFASLLEGRTGKIKTILLDQKLIAGIGNIYADEILFDAGLHPERTGGSLTEEERGRLYQSIRQILAKGIAHRGTSIRNYVDGDGRNGSFQKLLRVYGKEGEPCPLCGCIVSRRKVGGRSSYFCPACQRI
jgi:formamidopyrimidine-DNA glycosylase